MSISQSIAEKTVDNCFISELRNDGHGQHYMSRPLSGGDIKTKNTTLEQLKNQSRKRQNRYHPTRKYMTPHFPGLFINIKFSEPFKEYSSQVCFQLQIS